ncbi:MAG: GMC family oxidoreductase N-terminal domain-containing protein [Mariniblastus sp.]|nr:GMC family oxidoreductase N-terminal domain-containing protein [Mariniblastus sp.]
MANHESKNNCQSSNCSDVSRRSVLKAAVAGVAGISATQRETRADGPVRNLVKIGKRTISKQTPLKQRAQDDYRNSLAQYGGQLSNPIRELFLTAKNENQIHFGVLVIGSGYGAAITAAKLSQKLRPGYRICVMERGKEWLPGTFPDSFSNVMGNTRNVMSGPTKGKLVQPLGLFNIQFNDEVNILAGNGLGGGSLINASVALRPHREVFEQGRWPVALNNIETLSPYYDEVDRSLSLSRTPMDQTPKVRSRRLAAARMSCDPNFFEINEVSVMYDHRYLDDQMHNPQGMIQRPCNLCGDCINGCNVGAKNTLAMNYLPVAKHNGTEMYTQVEVNSIEKRDGHYRVHMTYIDDQHNKITRHPVSVNTQMVVVGAGSPSSAAILLDSQTESFQFSPKLGHNWSANGDAIGFVTNLAPGNNIGGFGADCSSCVRGVGPTVQTSLNLHRHADLHRRILIQDSAIPRGVSNLFTALLGDPSLDKSMAMLGMGHDEANGRLTKKDGRWQVKWEGLKDSNYRKMVFAEFDRLARAHGGKYKRLKAFGNNLVTVHPLGGCGMSDDPNGGPTNHLGQVYDYSGGGYLDPTTNQPAVHTGLYVADGSVIPTALGVNPYMTISALSQRIANHIVHNPAHLHLFD